MNKRTKNVIVLLIILVTVFFIGRIFLQRYEKNVTGELDHIAKETKAALDKNFGEDLQSDTAIENKRYAKNYLNMFEDIGFVFEEENNNDKTIYKGRKEENDDTLKVDVEIVSDKDDNLLEINTRSDVKMKTKQFTVSGFYASLPYNILELDQDWFQSSFKEAVKETAKKGVSFSNSDKGFDTTVESTKEELKINIIKE